MRSCAPCTIRQTTTLLVTGATLVTATAVGHAQGLQSGDLTRLRNVGQVALSPDGRTVAYTVVMRDQPGRPYGQLWVADIATQRATRLGGDKMHASQAHWSPDGQWIAYEGGDGQQSGLWIVHPDGSAATFLAQTEGSNSPLPGQGETISWSPDSKQIAYVSATPGPGDGRGNGRSAGVHAISLSPDRERRLHALQRQPPPASLSSWMSATKQVPPAHEAVSRDEHSIDWSPDGKEIVLRLRTTTRTPTSSSTTMSSRSRSPMAASAASRRSEARSTRPSGRRTASTSRTRARNAASRTARRRWKTRTSGSWMRTGATGARSAA